jgi:hypothetical protein
VVAADLPRDAFFIADVRLAEGLPHVGVVRSSAATLLSPTLSRRHTHGSTGGDLLASHTTGPRYGQPAPCRG